MIKRYDIDPRPGHFDLVRDDDGYYVRYADISHMIEEKTLEHHRAEFYKFATSHGLSVSKTDTDLHISHTVGWMWQAWKAAKGIKE